MVGRMTDRGVVLRIATKATSRPEGGPRLVRNPDEELESRTQGRDSLRDHLIRVNDAAGRSRQTRFTALLHHWTLGRSNGRSGGRGGRRRPG